MNSMKTLAICLLLHPFAAYRSMGAVSDFAENELLADSAAICVGTAKRNRVFTKSPNGRIFTATGFAVSDSFKGTFATTVQIEYRGGELNGLGEIYCDMPVFKTGTTYLLFIGRRGDGSLYCLDYLSETDAAFSEAISYLRRQAGIMDGTGQDVSDQTAPNLLAAVNFLPGSTGLSSRFLQGDRGEPIEYVVDMDAWPTGISSNQALTAVSNAFEAWSAATSLTFKFGGVESFGRAAPDVSASDERIYIQLHDNYNYIDPSSTLGRGGRSYTFDTENWPDGGFGGRVGTNEFDQTTQGYLVMEHEKASLSTLANFEEVLCHEIGHVLSMGHSSEDSGETDPLLADATMYYQAQFDGRGASIREWDTTTVRMVYPPINTPPYGYDRIIRAMTSPSPQAPLGSGINQVEILSYDLQDDASSPELVSSTSSNGEFTLEGSNTIFYTPSGWFGDSTEISDNGYYDRCFLRLSDGVNLSPPIQVRVIQYLSDDDRNYLPNSWETAYSVSGGATDDDDGDGLTNLDEWFIGTAPTDHLSGLSMGISDTGPFWNSRINELYQVQSAEELTDGFSNLGNPVLANSTNQTLSIEYGSQAFFRVQRLK